MARGGGSKGSKGGKRVTRSIRAGLTFPMTRVKTQMKRKFANKMRMTWGASAYTAAVMEYLSAEVLEIGGNVAKDFKVRRITPRHILLAVLNDQELAQLCKGVTFPAAGVLPFIHQNLLPKHVQKPHAHATAMGPVKMGRKTVKQSKAAPKPKSVSAKKVVTKGKSMTTLSKKTLLNTNVTLSVMQGDIVNVQCDALVHPTDNALSLTGEVGTHLGKVGGKVFNDIIEKAKKAGKSIGTMQADITDASGFACQYVIHCNGPNWGTSTSIPGLPAKTIPQLTKTVRACLKVADDNKLKSIAFPSIGSGVGGFPKHTAAEVIIRAIEGYFMDTKKTSIENVYFVLYDRDSVNVYITELSKLD